MKKSWFPYRSNPNDVTIPRGTLQVTFLHKGFDETRRLGLQSGTEQMVRLVSSTRETGMLVVDSVVPGGPAHKHLEPGDILVHVNGEVVTQFLKLETMFDDSVGKEIDLHIERGGTSLTVKFKVQDLHSITPNHFIEISGAVIHPLSYQQARNFHCECGLVYVAERGYMLHRAGVPHHAIITKFAGEEISQLDDLISVLAKLSRGSWYPLEFASHTDGNKSVLVTMDHHEWYAPPQIYTRSDITGFWTPMAAVPPNSPLASLAQSDISILITKLKSNSFEFKSQPRSKNLDEGCTRMQTNDEINVEVSCSSKDSNFEFERGRVGDDSSVDGNIILDGAVHEHSEPGFNCPPSLESSSLSVNQLVVATDVSLAERAIERALVMFEVHVPPSCLLDGVHSQHFSGTGVIIYHSNTMGLAAVDRNTVAVSASDIMLSFAAVPIEIRGQVVFLHPVYNYALVSYNPSALGADASIVCAAELLPEPALCRGDSVYLVGLNRSLQVKSRKSIVTNPYTALDIKSAKSPRYRAINMEVIELDSDFGSSFTGVLTDAQGRAQALWASFSTQYGSSNLKDQNFVRGIPIYAISQVLDKITRQAAGHTVLINGVMWRMPYVRILEVELYPTLLYKARNFGLSDSWIQALLKKDPMRRQVLCVKGCLAGSKAKELLKRGDMILSVNQKPITCFRDIADVCEELGEELGKGDDGKLTMIIFREGQEIECVVGTDIRCGSGTTYMINWCGCVVQDPHGAVKAIGERTGVYVSRWCHGSPADSYGLHDRQWIVEIDGKIIPDLDTFRNVVKELGRRVFVRVKTLSLGGDPRVLSIKQDLFYWPTWELIFDAYRGRWTRRIVRESLLTF